MRDREQEEVEELVLYIERVAGRPIRTREDVDRYLAFLAEVRPPKSSAAQGDLCLLAKRLVLVALTAFAAFQFFAIDVATEVLSIDRVRFLAPPPLPTTTRI